MRHAYARLWADRFLSMFNQNVARLRSHGRITGDRPVLDRTAISPSDAPRSRMSTKTLTKGFYGGIRPLARDAASELIVAVPVTRDHELNGAHVPP